MNPIRQAISGDAERIAEILVFNYRIHFYPIFRNDAFYFDEMKVSRQIPRFARQADSILVYDDGVVKGFIQTTGQEVEKLFVEPALQGKGIGSVLLSYAVSERNARYLWVLEKNERAISFYRRHGFCLTGERKREEDTDEFLLRMAR